MINLIVIIKSEYEILMKLGYADLNETETVVPTPREL